MPNSLDILYFYGFISSPFSTKAQYFKKQFKTQGIKLKILDLVPNVEDFTNMQPSHLIKKIQAHIRAHEYKNLVLMGSSFGGLLAAWYAAEYHETINKLILMAPALKFSASRAGDILQTTLKEWKVKGSVPIFHDRFDREIFLFYSFIEDLVAHPPPDFSILAAPVPTLIFHGKDDAVVPVAWSKEYASNRSNVDLLILNSDHQLLDQLDLMWANISEFLRFQA